jgi:hypothetical protein
MEGRRGRGRGEWRGKSEYRGRGRGENTRRGRGKEFGKGGRFGVTGPQIKFREGMLLMKSQDDKGTKWTPAEKDIFAFYKGFNAERENNRVQGKKLENVYRFINRDNEGKITFDNDTTDETSIKVVYTDHTGTDHELRYHALPSVDGDSGSFTYRFGEIEFRNVILLLGGTDTFGEYWSPATNEFYGPVQLLRKELNEKQEKEQSADGLSISFLNTKIGRAEKIQIKETVEAYVFHYVNCNGEQIQVYFIDV